jgi:hypothetical protein
VTRPSGKVTAQFGVVAGLCVYLAAFLLRSPAELCSEYEFPPRMEFGWIGSTFVPEHYRTLSPAVSATCRVSEPDGFAQSVVLIDWPANVVALMGLVIVAVSGVMWFRSRSTA